MTTTSAREADAARRVLIDSTRLSCPLCRTWLEYVFGAQDERRRCPRCRLVVKLPRVALAAAIRRASGR
jgi:LSD1 subclass zinc finger protein